MFTYMTKLITARDVSPNLWRELKVEAVKEGLTMGEAINLALEKWLHEHKNKKKISKSFLDLEPLEFKGEDAKYLSTKVDEILYGWKK